MKRRLLLSPIGLALLWLAGLAASASAATFTSSSNQTLAPEGIYQSTTSVAYLGGPVIVTLEGLRMHDASGGPTAPPPGSSFSSFFDVFVDWDMSIAGGPTLHGTDPGAFHSRQIAITNFGATDAESFPEYDTEMLTLDIGGLPSGLMIRESPTLASTGKTGIQDQGDGSFRIHSFFDVFTELSFDGGGSWVPATGPMHLVSLPEPSGIALGMMGALALLGMTCHRHRRS